MKKSQKGSVLVVLLVIVVVILLGLIIYKSPKVDTYPSPYISSIYPQKGGTGTVVTIVGKNLVDNRGEQNVLIYNSNLKGYLVQQDIRKNDDNTWTMQVKIDSDVCMDRLTDRGYCTSKVKLTPGTYSLSIDHTNSNGNHMSNSLGFILE